MTDSPPGARRTTGPERADRSVTRHGPAGDGGPHRPEIDRSVADLLAPAWSAEPSGPASEPVVEIVDVGANPIDGDPPYRPLLDGGWGRVTGFEPQPGALAELRRRAGPGERYLPYAVGDGHRHTLHLCATSGFASLLEPDQSQLDLLIDFPALARVVDRQPVDTHRLDDIAEIDSVDYLKIDIQGGELAVLRAGRESLRRAVAVQTEVGFHRLYRDQPTFAEVDLELRRQGFVPHQFVTTRTWPLAPVVWADPLERAARQLVEADVLYVRDPVRAADCDDGQLARLALIADVVYGSAGLALRCVLELVRRGALPPDAADRYRRLAATRLAA
ncbi:FkbM family methyltransferase [Nakamurella sp.]|uniref:FkbM family methyltransferase n=1 Tax=Nakamurella sp. TaxID=1869182 RepID=UPI003B3B46E4